MNRRSRRRAFSLVELLTVIVIIAVLIGLLMPVFGSARQARTAACANNLRQIGQSLTHWHVKNEPGYMAPVSWRTDLAKYADDAKLLFSCPQPDNIGPPLPGSAFGAPGLQIYVRDTGSATKLEEGPWMRKSNVSADGSKFRLHFEDIQNGGGDFDFNDVVLDCSVGPDGSFSLTVVENSHGYTFDLQDSAGNTLCSNFGRDGAGTGNGYTYTHAPTIDSDYAMNNRGDAIRKSNQFSEKILFVDYRTRDIANPDKDAAIWATSAQARVQKFARHFNRMNVLYGDGSVQLAGPTEINLTNAQLRAKYWSP